MFGMEMLLKNLGLDPETIKTSIESFGQVVVDLKSQMDRIENKLDAVLAASDRTAEISAAVPLIGSNEPIETKTLQIMDGSK